MLGVLYVLGPHESPDPVVIEWARLSPFPERTPKTTLTLGNPATREFRVFFLGEPELIGKWVESCPGVADPKCIKSIAQDGSIFYEYPAGGGASYAQLIHFPVTGAVYIRTYWS